MTRGPGSHEMKTRRSASYCICRGPDDGSLMIQCSKCHEWYHARCLGLEEQAVSFMSEYVCLSCKSNSPLSPRRTVASSPVRDRGQKLRTGKSIVDEAAQSVVIKGLVNALKLNLDEAICDVRNLAQRIGDELLKHCKSSNEYRQKYRTICSNLKDKRNRELCAKLARGEMSTERLVTMGPEELANVEIHQMASEIAESSIKSVILTNYNENFEKKSLNNYEIVPIMLDTAPPTSELVSNPTRDDGRVADSRAIDWTTSIIQPDGPRHFLRDAFLLKTKIEYKNSFVKSLLPVNLHVSGRVESETAMQYVKQIMTTSSSRSAIFITLYDTGNVGDSEEVVRLDLTLRETNRWLVLAFNPASGIRDMYIAPAISMVETLRELSIEIADGDLILIIIVARGQIASTSNNTQTSVAYDPRNSSYTT